MANTRAPHLQAQVSDIIRDVQAAVQHLPPHPFGHAFLHGTITVKYKNGNPKAFRACLGSICTSELEEAVRLASQVPGVSNVYYNMD